MQIAANEPAANASSRSPVHAYGSFFSQRTMPAREVGAGSTYGLASVTLLGAHCLRDVEEPDVLAQAIADAGPAVPWNPPDPDDRAERFAISDAVYAAQMEAITRRDAE